MIIKTLKLQRQNDYFIKLVTLLFFFALLIASKANAQNCNCTITKNGFFVWVTSCTVPNSLINNSCPQPPANNEIESCVLIEYTVVDCGGNVGIFFNTATFYGSRYAPPTGYSNQDQDYKDAQQVIMAQQGAGTNLTFLYPAGCQTIAEVTYPSPSPCYYFIPEGPNQGQISSIIDIGNPSPILELLPCTGSSCCTLNYAYDASTGRYKLTGFNPAIITCPSQPPQITTKDYTCYDINGNLVTYTGTVNLPNNCESYCQASLNTLFKTSGSKEFESLPDPFEVSIKPIPASDFITFSETKTFEKVEIYEISGKLIKTLNQFRNNQIDVDFLRNGIHIIRIYFKDSSIRSFRISKQ